MLIRETNLDFTSRLRRRDRTDQIIIHHTASGDVSAEEMHGWHLQNDGWGGLGYHYIVRTNGTVERGRPEKMRGIHARGANANSIGIALCGNFTHSRPFTAQIDSLAELIQDIRTRYPNIPVVRHQDRVATACPGNLFPWDELQERLTLTSLLSGAALEHEVYTVVPGDTLWRIAAAKLGNGARHPEIRDLNNLASDTLEVGQRLKLPKG
jgi:N-acetyl-anhydromuramyl-L-alanine amidase AmpD